ncbi:hypothetical protein NW762_011196 [Fusarium torreyae]|uniref:Uncharacterized protein n=1 Tax=Fusarium torreyae TaxID=1237075 RepID=A0A9W8RRL6_9HYPO|nr:hypothetical protein NW762_011196 [Fusarium torreyae]
MSDYSSASSVDSLDSLDQLDTIVQDFSETPINSTDRVRFGHLTIPVCLHAGHNIVQELKNSIRLTYDTIPIIFVLSRIEHRLAEEFGVEGLTEIPTYGTKTLSYKMFLHILDMNSQPLEGDGAEAWFDGSHPWAHKFILPEKAFVIFSLDPDLSAECSLAVIGLTQWACDVSHRIGSHIRVLTTSGYFGNNLLSDLVGDRVDFPVAHYELTIPTHVNAVLEQSIDRGNAIACINHHLENSSENSRHAIIFIPPNEQNGILPVSVQNRYLQTRQIYDPALRMIATLAWTVQDPHIKGVAIQVSPDHPIPTVVQGFTHLHVVLGDTYARTVFDHTSRQIVQTKVLLTQEERDMAQWWCYQPTVDLERTHDYTGVGGLDHPGSITPRHVHVENSQAGGFIARLYNSPWCKDADRVLRCFIRSPEVMLEMRNRLRLQGILKPGSRRIDLWGAEVMLFEDALPTLGYDHSLAYFVAIESSTSEVREFKSLLAAFLSVVPEWNLECKQELLDVECRGWGKSLVSTGDLWLTFGIWKTRNMAAVESFDCEKYAESVCLARKEILESSSHYCAQHDLGHNQPPHRVNDETKDSPEMQLKEVLQHLLRAYPHQLVCTRLVPYGVDMRVSGVMDINKFKELERDGVVYGICATFQKCGLVLSSNTWAWIPHDLVMDWRREHTSDQTLAEVLSERV